MYFDSIKFLFNSVARNPSAITSNVSIGGWIKSIRVLKNKTFIDLQDGTLSSPLKIVLQNNNNIKTPFKLGQSVKIKNSIFKLTPNRMQPFELSIDNSEDIKLLGDVSNTFPLQKKESSLSFLRSLPLLKHRTDYLNSLLRFRSHVDFQLTNFFNKNNFTKVNPPILTSNDCEGAGDMFLVSPPQGLSKSYFGKNTYLTVSTQLHLEALSLALNKVYTISPCFRAEKSNTTRHLSEFWMLEAELCFTNQLHDITGLVESMAKDVVNSLLSDIDKTKQNLLPNFTPVGDNCMTVDEMVKHWEAISSIDKFPTITYTKAIELLESSNVDFKYEPKWGIDLKSEHERWLTDKYFKSPVFVTHYPSALKPFYMKKTENNPDVVECFDLLVPGIGEIIGGSLREDNHAILENEMLRRKMNLNNDLDWYLDLRKNGSISHGGFGLGIERFVSYLFGCHNIKDSIPYQRSSNSIIEL